VEVLDLTLTDPDLKGFHGGFSSGDYGYLVPCNNGATPYGSKVARIDLATFADVVVLDLALTDSDLKGFYGGFSANDHGYLVPYNGGVWNSKVVRFNLATFSTVEVLDLALTDPDLKGFAYGFSSGNYGYLIRISNWQGQVRSGKVVRFDLSTFSKVVVLDLAVTNSELTNFEGGFSAGNYGYAVPNQSGKVVRFGIDPNDPEPDTGACFHGSSTVSLSSGASKRFSDLDLGDVIKTSDGQGHFAFNPVLTLPHKLNNSEAAAFLTLITETGKMVDMTSDHIVPKCDQGEVTAGELVVGDCLVTVDGKETLMEVSSTAKNGVFTATTQDKFIVVGGIVVSSYSKDSDPAKPELDYKKYRLELAEKRERHLAVRMSKHQKRMQGAHTN